MPSLCCHASGNRKPELCVSFPTAAPFILGEFTPKHETVLQTLLSACVFLFTSEPSETLSAMAQSWVSSEGECKFIPPGGSQTGALTRVMAISWMWASETWAPHTITEKAANAYVSHPRSHCWTCPRSDHKTCPRQDR